MEDVLEVYERPLNKKRPVVCVDEGKRNSEVHPEVVSVLNQVK